MRGGVGCPETGGLETGGCCEIVIRNEIRTLAVAALIVRMIAPPDVSKMPKAEQSDIDDPFQRDYTATK